MTVSSTTKRNSYTGDGSTTTFAYSFKIFDDDDITVIVRTTATGTESVQSKTTHYSVTGVGSASGGNVAVVFRGKKLPRRWLGIEVIDGDDSDLRFQDGEGKIVGLLEKGLAKKDETGFVVEPC